MVVPLFALSGCLIVHEARIEPDSKVDPRLEGVWQITGKLHEEIRSERDQDDIGVNGYLIFAPLENIDGSIDKTAYKLLAIESYERDTRSNLPDLFVSTRRHGDHSYLLIRAPDYVRAEAPDDVLFEYYWLVDYEFNGDGELFLRFLFVDDFDEIQKARSIAFDDKGGIGFHPIILKGDQKQILDIYSDPKIRDLLTSMGKYQRLKPLKEPIPRGYRDPPEQSRVLEKEEREQPPGGDDETTHAPQE